MKHTTLVLGGGGVWGVAWMTGLVRGLADGGLDLRAAEAFIGTSAGSVVSAQLAHGIPLDRLFERQVDPARQPQESRPSLPPAHALQRLGELLRQPTADREARAREIGAIAANAKTIDPARRRADIAERLGLDSDTWPEKRLITTAV